MHLPKERPVNTTNVSGRKIRASNTPLYKTGFTALIIATLTACGGGSSDGISDGGFSFIGTIGFTNDNAFGLFYSFESPAPLSTLDTVSDLLSDTDTCAVNKIDLETFDPDDIDDTDTSEQGPEFISVSAGEVLTVISPAGTFTELTRNQFGDEIEYEVGNGEFIPGPVTAGTVINIPGDVFPAFDEVAIPVVDGLSNFSPSSLPISTSYNFTWTPPAENTSSFVILVLLSDPSSTNSTFSSATCILIDDGSFTLPAGIQSELGPDFEVASLGVVRTELNIVTQGDAAVIVAASSALESIGAEF